MSISNKLQKKQANLQFYLMIDYTHLKTNKEIIELHYF